MHYLDYNYITDKNSVYDLWQANEICMLKRSTIRYCTVQALQYYEAYIKQIRLMSNR